MKLRDLLEIVQDERFKQCLDFEIVFGDYVTTKNEDKNILFRVEKTIDALIIDRKTNSICFLNETKNETDET